MSTSSDVPGAPQAPSLFISYRRSDGAAAGRLAHDLKDRFGAERVFFDTEDLEQGVPWQAEITDRICNADAVIAVIGKEWLSVANERGRRRVVDPDEEDVLRTEIETALRSARLVVPVLVDSAAMPPLDSLPRPFKPLAGLNTSELRNSSWRVDVEEFVAQLRRRIDEPRPESHERGRQAPVVARRAEPAPKDDEYADIVRFVREGSIVPVLGSDINDVGVESTEADGKGRVSTAAELAMALADRFDLQVDVELPRISQLISSRFGAGELQEAMGELLTARRCPPALVHRFLARLPGMLRESGRERYQLIVTANYDTTLECAFDEVHEPFDLAVFMPDRMGGHFLHIPWWSREGDEPPLIDDANKYLGFPIDDAGRLSHTVIMKIHGGGLHDAPLEWRRANRAWVITEDDYIGYLSAKSAESLVPPQILDRLRNGHLLFMGYSVRDWSLRVFLQRLWTGYSQASSWAVEPEPDTLAKAFWKQLGVERISSPIPAYLAELERRLTGA